MSDVNGDGKADVIWQNTNNGTMAAWLMIEMSIRFVGFPGATPIHWKIRD